MTSTSRELVGASFVPLQVDPLYGIPFRGSLTMNTVNEVAVFELTQTPTSCAARRS